MSARNRLLEANKKDEESEVRYTVEPDGAVDALFDRARTHEIDVTVKTTYGFSGHGKVILLRNGGDPLELPIVGGKIALTAVR